MDTWFCILTLTLPLPSGGVATGTKSRLLPVEPDTTRGQLYEHMRSLFPPEYCGATVVFFSAEPNRLPIGGEQS